MNNSHLTSGLQSNLVLIYHYNQRMIDIFQRQIAFHLWISTKYCASILSLEFKEYFHKDYYIFLLGFIHKLGHIVFLDFKNVIVRIYYLGFFMWMTSILILGFVCSAVRMWILDFKDGETYTFLLGFRMWMVTKSIIVKSNID
jgi:hypothetical protein